TCPGVVLIGDAAGHNDPVLGQGLSIALRDVRLVNEILGEAKAAGREPDFRSYVEERAERMRRLRITAQVATTLRVEFGQEARERRARVGKRVAAGQLGPLPASLIGPERLPAEAFLPESIERLLASWRSPLLGPRVGGSRGRLRNWRPLPIGGGRSRLLWEKHQRLSVQRGKAHRSSEKCTCREIEGANLVLRTAIEIPVSPKATASLPAKFGRAIRGEDADKLSADGVVFANGRNGAGC